MLGLVLSVLISASRAPDVTIDAGHVGPITADMRVSTETLRRSFPGARIEPFDTEGVGGFKDGGHGWKVWLNGTDLALAVPSDAQGTRWTVNIIGPAPVTVDGLRVGSRVDELLALGPVRCRTLPEEEREVLACARVNVPNLEFVFVPISAELAARNAAGGLPAGFIPERGTDRAIGLIVWTPPRQNASPVR